MSGLGPVQGVGVLPDVRTCFDHPYVLCTQRPDGRNVRTVVHDGNIAMFRQPLPCRPIIREDLGVGQHVVGGPDDAIAEDAGDGQADGEPPLHEAAAGWKLLHPERRKEVDPVDVEDANGPQSAHQERPREEKDVERLRGCRRGKVDDLDIQSTHFVMQQTLVGVSGLREREDLHRRADSRSR